MLWPKDLDVQEGQAQRSWRLCAVCHGVGCPECHGRGLYYQAPEQGRQAAVKLLGSCTGRLFSNTIYWGPRFAMWRWRLDWQTVKRTWKGKA